jgi:hypothetical protein
VGFNVCNSSKFGLVKGGLDLGGSPMIQRILGHMHVCQLNHGMYHEQRGSHKGLLFLDAWYLK